MSLLRSEAEDFYIHEAWLLDKRDLAAWFVLFAPEFRYWAPIRADVEGDEGEFSDPERLALFDDNHFTLDMRVKRFLGAGVHSSTPAPRYRHNISNVKILGESPRGISITSNFLCYKNRLQDEALYSGRRDDILQEIDGQWRIAERCVVFDHGIIGSLTIFF